MNISPKLLPLKVVIISHVYATGPAHALEEFLRQKVAQLVFIGHPFVFAKDARSHLRQYRRSTKPSQEKYFNFTLKNQLLSIIKDTLLSFWWLSTHGKIDLFIGVDATNTLVGLILKKMGLVKVVVFYTIDYVPKRFEHPLLNRIYHFLDQLAVKHSDVVWNLSDIMVSEREKQGISPQYRTKQIVVPVGTENTVKQLPFNQIKRYQVAHMGHLLQKQGVQLLIQAIPLIVKKIPQFHAEIIGGGEYEPTLKALATQLQVSKYLTFHGFIKSHTQLESLLSYCAIGIAPYVDSPDNYVRYTDPGKVKAYLAAGLPVIVTTVPSIASKIEQSKCGLAVKDTPAAIAKSVITLLGDTMLLRKFRGNAKNMAKEFAWDKIFTQALLETKNLVGTRF